MLNQPATTTPWPNIPVIRVSGMSCAAQRVPKFDEIVHTSRQTHRSVVTCRAHMDASVFDDIEGRPMIPATLADAHTICPGGNRDQTTQGVGRRPLNVSFIQRHRCVSSDTTKQSRRRVEFKQSAIHFVSRRARTYPLPGRC